jgi:hypothetical protein
MALTAGTVTVDSSGVAVGSGAALSLYNLLNARATAQIASATYAQPAASVVAAKQGMANLANDLASWLVTEITTNAKAQITTSDTGLQRTPNPNNADTATQAPSATKLLAIV